MGATDHPAMMFSPLFEATKIKEIKLNIIMCPAVMFANSLIIKANGFVNIPTISIGIMIGISTIVLSYKMPRASPKAPRTFLSHTKRSTRWNCEDFVRDHLWDFLYRQGITAFYDRVGLLGRSIDQCLKIAKAVDVMFDKV